VLDCPFGAKSDQSDVPIVQPEIWVTTSYSGEELFSWIECRYLLSRSLSPQTDSVWARISSGVSQSGFIFLWLCKRAISLKCGEAGLSDSP